MLAVIRIRGSVNVKHDIAETMHSLRLNQVNHCVLLDLDATTKGMLQKVKDYCTWGEVEEEVLTEMLEKRGRMVGNRPIDKKALKALGTKDLASLAKKIIGGDVPMTDPIKPVFRLHPPARGFEGIKKSYKTGGALGYRGQAINDLIRRMV